MKKKISLLILTLIFALSFTGCGNNKNDAIEYDSASLQQISNDMIESFAQMQPEDFDRFLEGSDLEINLMLLQAGLPIERDTFVSMIKAWKTATKEAGAYVGHDEFVIDESNDKITLTANGEFEERNADIVFVFDENLKINSLTIDLNYSKGEVFQKAIYNTLLGMGTVFTVLILIAFLISLFKHIPALERKILKKAVVEEQAVKISSDMIEKDNVASSGELKDLELVAVITAAIRASDETNGSDFVVRSIKRRTSNKWKQF